MYYLADFAYQEPHKKYWEEVEKRVKKDPDYNRFYKVPLRDNYRNKSKAYRITQKINSRLGEDIILDGKPYKPLSEKREKELKSLKHKLAIKTNDRYRLDDKEIFDPTIKKFRGKYDEFLYKMRDKHFPEMRQIGVEDLKGSPMKLSTKLGIGALGTAGIIAGAYGLNKLRKTRSDKNKKRGIYKK